MEPQNTHEGANHTQERSVGPAIGIIIIILSLVIGSLYFFAERMKQNRNTPQPTSTTTYTTEAPITIIATTTPKTP